MKGADYGFLFIVIALGVAAGNLLSDVVRLGAAAYGLQQSASAMHEATQARLARARADEAQRRARAAAQRAASPQGMTLARACEDWRRAQRDMPNHTSVSETRRHCDRYNRFVETGSPDP